MTWSYVTASNTIGGTNASYTPVITGVQEHDLVVMTATCKGGGADETTLGMGAGWTLIAGVPVTATTDAGLYVWYAIAGAEGALPSTIVSRLTGGGDSQHYHRAFAYRSSSGAPTKGTHTLTANLAAGSTATLSSGVSSAATGALIITYATAGGSTTFNSVTATDPSALSASSSPTYHTSDPEVDVWRQRFGMSGTAGSGYSYAIAETIKTSVGSTGPIVWGKNNSTRKSSVLAISFEVSGSSDTDAPTLASPTASATGATTASGSVSTNEANGTLYYLASANATELAATAKAGSSQAVSASGVQNVTVTGLTASTSYYLHYLHRDAAGNDSDVVSSAQFTTDAPSGDADPPTLISSVTFANITQTTYTAQWPAGSDNVAVTGYEYQIGGTAGAWTDVGNNLSVGITGRTAGTTETVYVRAYDAAGLRSTPAISGEVTLESSSSAGINVTDPLKNNTGTVLASQSGVRVAVLQAADLVSVYEATGLTTNASGILATISDAAIITGQQYHVAIKLADGSVGITGPITAS